MVGFFYAPAYGFCSANCHAIQKKVAPELYCHAEYTLLSISRYDRRTACYYWNESEKFSELI